MPNTSLRGSPRSYLDQTWILSGSYLDLTRLYLDQIPGHTHRDWDFWHFWHFRNIFEEPLVPPSEFHTTFQLAASWNLSVASAFLLPPIASVEPVAREPSLRIWTVSVFGLKLLFETFHFFVPIH